MMMLGVQTVSDWITPTLFQYLNLKDPWRLERREILEGFFYICKRIMKSFLNA